MRVYVCLLRSNHINSLTHIMAPKTSWGWKREVESRGMLVAAAGGDFEIALRSVKFLPSLCPLKHICVQAPQQWRTFRHTDELSPLLSLAHPMRAWSDLACHSSPLSQSESDFLPTNISVILSHFISFSPFQLYFPVRNIPFLLEKSLRMQERTVL